MSWSIDESTENTIKRAALNAARRKEKDAFSVVNEPDREVLRTFEEVDSQGAEIEPLEYMEPIGGFSGQSAESGASVDPEAGAERADAASKEGVPEDVAAFRSVLKPGERYDLTNRNFDDACFDNLLFWGKERNISDFSFRTSDYVRGMTGRGWRIISSRPIGPTELDQVIYKIVNTTATSSMLNGNEIAKSYQPRNVDSNAKEKGRFRFSGTCIKSPVSDESGFALVLRSLPVLPPTVKELGIERDIVDNFLRQNSLSIVTGGTGHGKSTTLYSLLFNIVQEDIIKEGDTREPKGLHILDYSSPIEYTLDSLIESESFISQTDVGFMLRDPDSNTESATWGYAARNALRRKPDLIVIAETRDKPTMDADLVCANTGHQALTTMHNNSVSSCFQRILRFYPRDERIGVATDLIGYLNIVINQQLLPRKGGGKVAVREYLVVNDYVKNRLLAISDAEIWPMEVQKILEENSSLPHDKRLCACQLKMHHAKRLLDSDIITQQTYDSVVQATHILLQGIKEVGDQQQSDDLTPRTLLPKECYRDPRSEAENPSSGEES